MFSKLVCLRYGEVTGIPGVGVKSVDIRRNAKSEGSSLAISDAERRKRGEQTGLDTLVVHAVNYEY